MDPRVDGVLAIELLDGRPVGMVDYRDLDTIVRSATVGITVGEKELWGQGLGTEALGLLLRHLFDRLNLRRVQLDTWSGNERAIRAFTRLDSKKKGGCAKQSTAPAATTTRSSWDCYGRNGRPTPKTADP